MQPRKDYDDYTSFINDAYAEDKTSILTKEAEPKKLHFRGQSAAVSPTNKTAGVSPFETLRASAPEPNSGSVTVNVEDRFKTMRSYYSSLIKQSGPTQANLRRQFGTVRNKSEMNVRGPMVEVKPRVLESRISQNKDFFDLSDGFKRIFSNDKKDKKMVIPIAGYGGHRRGDRSQNFFGKSFRESSL